MAKIRNRYNQVLHLTQDPTLESDKNSIIHYKREPRGDNKASVNRRESMANTRNKNDK